MLTDFLYGVWNSEHLQIYALVVQGQVDFVRRTTLGLFICEGDSYRTQEMEYSELDIDNGSAA
jgi:hypothetical protein